MITKEKLNYVKDYEINQIPEVPDEWDVMSLGDTKNKHDRYSFAGGPFGSDLTSSEYKESGVQIIQLQNINEGKFNNKYRIFTTEEKANSLSKCNIFPGEIVIAKMAEPVARACIVPDHEERFLMASDSIRLSPDKNKFDVKFLMYAINASYFRKQAVVNSTGTTRLRIGLTSLAKLELLVPPLNEQQKIAEILSAADEQIEKTEQLIGKIKELKKGLMQQLLTMGINQTEFKETEIGRIPAEWEHTSLDKVIDIKNGYAFESQYYSNEGEYILLTPGNFYPEGGLKLKGQKEKYFLGDINNDFLLEKDDLLVVLTDLTQSCNILGSPAVITENNKYLHNQRLGKVNIKESNILKEFLYYLFNSASYRNHLKNTATGTTVRHTSAKRILEIKIPVPPIKEQRLIVNILLSIDDRIEGLKREKEKQTELKTALTQQLLTGKLRVTV